MKVVLVNRVIVACVLQYACVVAAETDDVTRGVVLEPKQGLPSTQALEPRFQQSEDKPFFELPSLDHSLIKTPAASWRIQITSVKFHGNTVFSDDQLSAEIATYLNRPIGSDELQSLRHQLTLYYVQRGYINSGVIIPDQQIIDGELELKVIEGRLDRTEIKGNDRLKTSYVEKRIGKEQTPLNVNVLQRQLQLLQSQPAIERVQAELVPGHRLGTSVLNLNIEEEQAFFANVHINNHRSPSTGEVRGSVELGSYNVTGNADSAVFEYGITEGLNDLSLAYSLPVLANDTSVSLYYDRSDSVIVEAPYDNLDIESESTLFRVGVNYPFPKSVRQKRSIEFMLDRNHTETFLLNEPYSFSLGAENGETKVSAARIAINWLDRDIDQVRALYFRMSSGLDIFGSTTHRDQPDSRFFSVLGQAQWVKKVFVGETIFRGDFQFSNDALLPSERFSLGGANTVRGYRENQLVRDNGWLVSLEYRMPIDYFSHNYNQTMKAAVFVDHGKAWNEDSDGSEPNSISSVGFGLRWNAAKNKAAGNLYWGHALRNVDKGSDDALQDSGIHFNLSLMLK